MRISGRLVLGLGMALAMSVLDGAGAADTSALTAAYNASGLSLLKQLSGKGGGNIVLSPLSIGTAMAMALSGARGDTAAEMAKGLQQSLAAGDMEAANAALMSTLHSYDKSAAAPKCPSTYRVNNGRCEAALPPEGRCPPYARRDGDSCVLSGSTAPSVRLLTANALMLPGRGDLVAPDYAALAADKYGADVLRNVSLGDVNGWVKRKTEGKIERILDKLDEASAAVILNAVYFKGKWASTFAKSGTQEQAFNLARGGEAMVPMMRRVGHYALAERGSYRAIRLPYEVGAIGMVVLLPNEINGLDAETRALDASEWTALLADLRPGADKLVDLTLPRFKAHFGADLVAPFHAEGIGRAFDLKLADFSGISGRPPAQVPLAIGAIAHRAVVDVMEDGTEAAAATAIAVVAAAVHQQPEMPVPFRVDHPFQFAIVDDATGAMLFLGRVNDPR
jgi:serpin B